MLIAVATASQSIHPAGQPRADGAARDLGRPDRASAWPGLNCTSRGQGYRPGKRVMPGRAADGLRRAHSNQGENHV